MEEGQYICDFGKGGMCTQIHIFEKMAVGYKEHMSPFMIVELFLDMGRCCNWS